MRGQAKIVIGGEIDDFFAVERTERGLLILKNAKAKMSAFFLEVIQLIGQVGERVGARSSLCRHGVDSVILRAEQCQEAASIAKTMSLPSMHAAKKRLAFRHLNFLASV
jgi:hypothetical protein